MKFELRLFREDQQQWAYADIEVNDDDIAAAPDRRTFIAQQIVPYIEAMEELQP